MIMGHENANGLLWTDISIAETKIKETKKCSLFLGKQSYVILLSNAHKKSWPTATQIIDIKDIGWQKKKPKTAA